MTHQRWLPRVSWNKPPLVGLGALCVAERRWCRCQHAQPHPGGGLLQEWAGEPQVQSPMGLHADPSTDLRSVTLPIQASVSASEWGPW